MKLSEAGIIQSHLPRNLGVRGKQRGFRPGSAARHLLSAAAWAKAPPLAARPNEAASCSRCRHRQPTCLTKTKTDFVQKNRL